MNTSKRYASEVRERAVRMVFEHREEHSSQWAAIQSIASKIGCTAESLRRWVKQSERDRGGIVERFNGTVRDETNNDYGDNYLQAEAIIAKLMHHYNHERLHATLGYMTPAPWHHGQPNQVRDERARRIAAARTHRKTINQQRFNQAA